MMEKYGVEYPVTSDEKVVLKEKIASLKENPEAKKEHDECVDLLKEGERVSGN